MTFVTLQRAAAIAVTTAGLALYGCQDDITLPETGGAPVGECGAFYPGGGDPDAGIAYGSNLGDTLPCFVWESVRAGAQETGADPAAYANAYLSMGEIFLKSKNPGMEELLESQFGVDEAKIILFAVVAENCSGCPELLGRVVTSIPELEEAGAIVVGVASFSSNDTAPDADAMDLVAADGILINDGFVETHYRTNDPEHYLGTNGSFGGGGSRRSSPSVSATWWWRCAASRRRTTRRREAGSTSPSSLPRSRRSRPSRAQNRSPFRPIAALPISTARATP